MAAIDKLHIKLHGDLKELVVWCIKHNPSLLEDIYEPFISQSEWYEMQGDNYKKWKKIPVADFSASQDLWLYWHCPLGFVREYLETQCGYKKANWVVKLFWRK